MADDDYCYLTTIGRRTGRPHRIEIWYAADGGTLYLLAGGRRGADWVRNLAAEPAVTVEVDGVVREGRARILDGGDNDDGDGERVAAERAEAERARTLVFEKYSVRSRDDLTGWRDAALAVAVDLAG